MKYNVGMYGGAFNPLHLGHVDCIITAASQCRELYVVLSSSENSNEIDERIRYRWLYQTTSHIGNVKLLILRGDYAQKNEYTENQALADCEYIKQQIGKKIDVVFCGSDYSKDSFWNYGYPDSEFVVFDRNEISSTEIRQNPYKHWDWLPNVVRPYYTKKVLLIGGESTGKSTLTINLANYFNTNYIDEAGREISIRSGSDKYMLQSDYTEILLNHKLNEINALQHSNKVLFIDTDALVTQFYLGFLEGDNTSSNVVLSNAIDAINEYDLILFLETDVAFVQDGTRNEEIKNERDKYSNMIKKLLVEHNKKFVVVGGTYKERYEKSKELVKALLEEEG